MDSQHQFFKGLYTDGDAQFQPANTYRKAVNWVLDETGVLSQELGFEQLVELSMPLRGKCALGDEVILFSGDATKGEIGVLRDKSYTVILSSDAVTFSQNNLVSAQAKIDFQGHRVVYFADGENFRYLDLDASIPSLPDGLQLVANPQSPLTTPFSVEEGGSLPTGIYQAAARLVTSSQNKAPFGLLSNVVPIVEEPLATERSQLDGAPPQTSSSKSIVFQLDNLDPSYRYAEIVVATYVGLSNQLNLHTLPLIPLNGRTSLRYTYYSPSQHEEAIELGELLSEYADYDSAQHLEQKDGVLLAANLTASQETIAWQAIANSIVLEPTTKEVWVPESVVPEHYDEAAKTGGTDTGTAVYQVDDYKNPLATTNYKGYHREEIYDFCFIPLFNGKRGNAYHIPAPESGYYTFHSAEYYPAKQGYPLYLGQDGQTQMRFHRMPTIEEKPLMIGGSGGYTLSILGMKESVKPDFSSLSDGQRKKLTGYLIGVQKRGESDKTILAQGIYQPMQLTGNFFTPGFFTGNDRYTSGQAVTASKKYAAFYSPETMILQNNMQEARILECLQLLTGTSYGVADHRTGVRKEKYAHLFFNFTNSVTPSFRQYANLDGGAIRYIPAETDGKPLSIGEDKAFATLNQNGYLLLKAPSSNIPLSPSPQNVDVFYEERTNATDAINFKQANGQTKNQNDANYKGICNRYLANLKTPRIRPYGDLSQAEYYPVVYCKAEDTELKTFFGGDTFVGKVAIQTISTEIQNNGEIGLQNRNLNYFVCESSVNVNYRHYQIGVGEQTNTLPYYPKLKKLWQTDGSGVMQFPATLGHPRGYNQQYSFNNTLTPYFLEDRANTLVSKFPNRIIYSAQSVEGEQLDAYRIFLPNNYHDIPKHRGSITDLFTMAGSLYVHTEQSLWKAFFNEATTQTTSEGETYLGNGGLFPRPSVEIVTVDGGYAGTKDKLASVNTPVGRFMITRDQGKLFVFNGQLQEIKEGMQKYLASYLKEGPFTGIYDYQQERYIMTGREGLPTLSYSLRTNTFASYHDYTITHPITRSQGSYICQGKKIYKLNAGTTGYYGEDRKPAVVDVVTAPYPDASKVFDDVQMHSRNLPSTLLCETQGQDSVEHKITQLTTYGQNPEPGEVLYRFANDQWQFTLPRDVNGGRLKGKWLRHVYTFPPKDTPSLLKLLTVLYRARTR